MPYNQPTRKIINSSLCLKTCLIQILFVDY